MKKTVKHILLCLLMLGILFSTVACGSITASDAEGTWGDLDWKYDASDRELTISGSGAMKKIESADEVPWKSVRSSAKTLTIEEGITSVADYAFQGFAALEKTLELPASLTEIGKLSFAFCSSLENVSFPEGLYSIGEGAFEGCSKLEKVFLHNNLSVLETRAFAFCYSMTELEILGTVAVEAETFFNCTALEKIQFHNSITSIDENAFRGTDVQEADIERTESETAAASVTILFVDSEGNTLAESIVLSDLAYGAAFSETVPPVEGYTPDRKVVSGKVFGLDVEEKVVYTKDAEQTEEVVEEKPAEEEPENNAATIIAVVIFAVVLVAIAVAAFLLIRADKKNQNRSQTVRKNDPAKNQKKGK